MTHPGPRGTGWQGGPPGRTNSLDEVRLVDLPRFSDERGSLSFVESARHVPFAIERAFWIYDVPSGATRAGHAHHVLQQLIIAMSGSFTVVTRTPHAERRYRLFTPFQGLYVPPMIWRDIEDFSSGAVALVFASTAYDETDYFEDFGEYRATYLNARSAGQ